MAKILVVDDDADVRSTLRRVLTSAGYTVAEAANGAEGMQLLTAQPFDLVVIDILMPQRDGFETIQALRQTLPGVKIIAISGAPRFGSYDPLGAAKTFGAHRTVSKPFEPAVILEAVRQLLSAN